MAKKQIPDTEKIYELKQDVWTPASYCRAGDRRTASEWYKEFGEFNIEWSNEWFIDLSEPEEKNNQHPLSVLIDKVFDRYHIHSLTYKDAAFEIAELWLKQNQAK